MEFEKELQAKLSHKFNYYVDHPTALALGLALGLLCLFSVGPLAVTGLTLQQLALFSAGAGTAYAFLAAGAVRASRKPSASQEPLAALPAGA